MKTKLNKTEVYISFYKLAIKKGFDKVDAASHAMEMALNATIVRRK